MKGNKIIGFSLIIGFLRLLILGNGITGFFLSGGIDSSLLCSIGANLDRKQIEAFTVFTNKPVAGAMRGYGLPQVAFAVQFRQMQSQQVT